MSDRARRDEERLLDLLADRAVTGLSADESAELESLLARFPAVDPDGADLAAAALHQAFGAEPAEDVPVALRTRLRQGAQAFVGERPLVRVDRPGNSGARAWPVWTGWAAAAVGFALWLTTSRVVAPPAPAPAEARAELVRTVPDAKTAAWTATADPAARGASGDVVWSSAAQSGFMSFRGLAANDPAVFQYQLWIFDGARDERYPIDGGVFDVRSGDEVVAIAAKLRVRTPTLFAVTVEKPGGVVVSARERIVLTARLGP